MRVTVVRPRELGDDEAALWAQFRKSSPDLQSPFFSLAFAQAVDRHRGNARVAVVEDGGVITAFLAFDVGPRRMGMPVGDPMNNVQGFITENTGTDARRIIRKAGLRGWRYMAAHASQRALEPHHYAETLVDASLLDLSKGYDAYLSDLSKRSRSDLRAQLRAAEKRYGPVTLEWGSTDPAQLQQMIDWKCAKYGGSRELFADPAARAIVEELSVSSEEECRGVVTVLRAGDQVLSVNSSLTAAPAMISPWFISYNPDPEMHKLSAGSVAIHKTAEAAAERGIALLDLGSGQEPYKIRMRNATYQVAGGAVWVSAAERAARQAYRRFRERAHPQD